jgi:acyl carrier protein
MMMAVNEVAHEPADIEAFVVEIIARKKKLAPSAVTAASTFEELGIDSLDAADLIFTVEDTYHVVVPDEAAASMRSVGQVVAGIRDLVGARAAEAR